MKVLNKRQVEKLMKEYPDGGIVLANYTPKVLLGDVMVTDGNFGATDVVPYECEVFDWDWNIAEHRDTDLFMVFDNNDVLQMIQTLVRGLKIDLGEWSGI